MKRRWKTGDLRYLFFKCSRWIAKITVRILKKITSSVLPQKLILLWGLFFEVMKIYVFAHENNALFKKFNSLCTKADWITIQGKFAKIYGAKYPNLWSNLWSIVPNVDVQADQKCHIFCRFTRKHPNETSGLFLTRFFEKPLFNVFY